MSTKALTQRQLDELLDEVLYEAREADADSIDPRLDGIVSAVARRLRLSPAATDLSTVAALVYEQLSAR